jgi:hypothetical protein
MVPFKHIRGVYQGLRCMPQMYARFQEIYLQATTAKAYLSFQEGIDTLMNSNSDLYLFHPHCVDVLTPTHIYAQVVLCNSL